MHLRVLRLPIQFVSVVVISAALIIYLLGWSAQSRVEGRNQSNPESVFRSHLVMNQPTNAHITTEPDVQKQSWERLVLFICPLH